MFRNKMTMLILSCDKFSDLWDAHVLQLEKYWADRELDTFIVTDKPSDKKYDKVSVLSAGEDKEFTERLAFALSMIKTKYVFITLDDYFLRERVKNNKIQNLLEMMEQENLDYARLFLRPKRARGKKFIGYKRIRHIINEKRYSVNLYSGIWRRDFMEKTIRAKKNPWQYEVSLSKIATELNAKCVVSNNREFVILDVVRKGKILNKANRYLKKHDIYHGEREVHTRWYEFKLNVRIFGARHMPKFIVNAARKFMIKRGHHYYSQDEE